MLPTKHEQPATALIARNVEELEKLGRICAASGFFSDSREAAQAMTKILAGQELGLAPIQSMTGINVIKNKVTLSANLMAALLKKAGYNWKILEHNAQVCNLQIYAPNGVDLGNCSFSIQDAKAAGLQGGNWQKYPKNMLFARCISNVARWYAPEVITGCYTPEELQAQPAQPAEPPQSQPTQPAEPPQPAQQAQPAQPAEPAEPAQPKQPDQPAQPAERKQSKNPNGHLHATCAEKGLTQQEIRWFLGVQSTTEATPEQKDAIAYALKEWTEKEYQSAYKFIHSGTLETLKSNWSQLTHPQQATLENSKNYLKLVLQD